MKNAKRRLRKREQKRKRKAAAQATKIRRAARQAALSAQGRQLATRSGPGDILHPETEIHAAVMKDLEITSYNVSDATQEALVRTCGIFEDFFCELFYILETAIMLGIFTNVEKYNPLRDVVEEIQKIELASNTGLLSMARRPAPEEDPPSEIQPNMAELFTANYNQHEMMVKMLSKNLQKLEIMEVKFIKIINRRMRAIRKEALLSAETTQLFRSLTKKLKRIRQTAEYQKRITQQQLATFTQLMAHNFIALFDQENTELLKARGLLEKAITTLNSLKFFQQIAKLRYVNASLYFKQRKFKTAHAEAIAGLNLISIKPSDNFALYFKLQLLDLMIKISKNPATVKRAQLDGLAVEIAQAERSLKSTGFNFSILEMKLAKVRGMLELASMNEMEAIRISEEALHTCPPPSHQKSANQYSQELTNDQLFVLLNLVEATTRLGKYQQAKAHFTEAERLVTTCFHGKHPIQTKFANYILLLNMRMGQDSAAQQQVDRMIAEINDGTIRPIEDLLLAIKATKNKACRNKLLLHAVDVATKHPIPPICEAELFCLQGIIQLERENSDEAALSFTNCIRCCTKIERQTECDRKTPATLIKIVATVERMRLQTPQPDELTALLDGAQNIIRTNPWCLLEMANILEETASAPYFQALLAQTTSLLAENPQFAPKLQLNCIHTILTIKHSRIFSGKARRNFFLAAAESVLPLMPGLALLYTDFALNQLQLNTDGDGIRLYTLRAEIFARLGLQNSMAIAMAAAHSIRDEVVTDAEINVADVQPLIALDSRIALDLKALFEAIIELFYQLMNNYIRYLVADDGVRAIARNSFPRGINELHLMISTLLNKRYGEIMTRQPHKRRYYYFPKDLSRLKVDLQNARLLQSQQKISELTGYHKNWIGAIVKILSAQHDSIDLARRSKHKLMPVVIGGCGREALHSLLMGKNSFNAFPSDDEFGILADIEQLLPKIADFLNFSQEAMQFRPRFRNEPTQPCLAPLVVQAQISLQRSPDVATVKASYNRYLAQLSTNSPIHTEFLVARSLTLAQFYAGENNLKEVITIIQQTAKVLAGHEELPAALFLLDQALAYLTLGTELSQSERLNVANIIHGVYSELLQNAGFNYHANSHPQYDGPLSSIDIDIERWQLALLEAKSHQEQAAKICAISTTTTGLNQLYVRRVMFYNRAHKVLDLYYSRGVAYAHANIKGQLASIHPRHDAFPNCDITRFRHNKLKSLQTLLGVNNQFLQALEFTLNRLLSSNKAGTVLAIIAANNRLKHDRDYIREDCQKSLLPAKPTRHRGRRSQHNLRGTSQLLEEMRAEHRSLSHAVQELKRITPTPVATALPLDIIPRQTDPVPQVEYEEEGESMLPAVIPTVPPRASTVFTHTDSLVQGLTVSDFMQMGKIIPKERTPETAIAEPQISTRPLVEHIQPDTFTGQVITKLLALTKTAQHGFFWVILSILDDVALCLLPRNITGSPEFMSLRFQYISAMRMLFFNMRYIHMVTRINVKMIEPDISFSLDSFDAGGDQNPSMSTDGVFSTLHIKVAKEILDRHFQPYPTLRGAVARSIEACENSIQKITEFIQDDTRMLEPFCRGLETMEDLEASRKAFDLSFDAALALQQEQERLNPTTNSTRITMTTENGTFLGIRSVPIVREGGMVALDTSGIELFRHLYGSAESAVAPAGELTSPDLPAIEGLTPDEETSSPTKQYSPGFSFGEPGTDEEGDDSDEEDSAVLPDSTLSHLK